MARPREYASLPVYGATQIDRIGAIRSILYQLEQGYFFDAARLWDIMRRDPRVSGALTTRWNALTQTPIDWQPGKDTSKGRKIMDEAEELWPQMVQAGALAQVADWGSALGIGVAELVWSKAWVPRIKVWHPQFIYWDWASRRFRLQEQGYESGEGSPEDAWVELPRTDRDVYSDGQWLIWCPGGFNEAWLRGHLRALAEPYLTRTWGVRDGARLSEVHGIPIRGVKVPSAASEKDKDRFVRSVGNIGNETVLELPSAGPEAEYDLKLIEAVGKGEIIQWQVNTSTDDINNVILGQNVSGEKVGGLGDGQNAQNENVRDDIRRGDCRIYEALRDQVLRWWTLYNHGDVALTPYPTPQVDPPEDQAKRAQVFVSLAQSLPVLRGMGVDVIQVLEDAGVPMTSVRQPEPVAVDGEPVAPTTDSSGPVLEVTPSAQGSIVKVNEARAQLGLGPLTRPDGSIDPDGELTIAAFQAKNAAIVGGAARAEQGSVSVTPADADAIPTETAPQESVEPAQFNALPPPTADVEPGIDPAPASRTYADRLSANAQAEAQDITADWVARVMDVVNRAKSFDEVRSKLARLYTKASPRQMAEIVERAAIMAELAGRYETIKGL